MEEEMISEMERGCLRRQQNDRRGMEEEMISEMERGCLRRQQNDRDTASATLREMEPEEMEDIERGFPTRELEESDENFGSATLEEGVDPWEKHAISKVPAGMAAVNPEAFTPKMVSMGPYHRGKEHLMPMEVHKERAALRFINDSGKSKEDFIDGLWEVLPELMDSYSQLDPVWGEDENTETFLELMLIDGCFLLEILRTIGGMRPSPDEHDPVFTPKGVLLYHHAGMKEDMMMLENQVPFTALEVLLTIKNGDTREKNSEDIKDLMLLYLYLRKRPDTRCRCECHCKALHMLDVARINLFNHEPVQHSEDEVRIKRWVTEQRGFLGADEETLKSLRDMRAVIKSRSVMELCRAGVEFRKAENETIPLSSIRFENNGVITIPVIPLHLLSEVDGCNMVAFELSRPGTLCPTLAYFTFMKGLLTSAADVRHLRTLKIIQSTESSDDAIVETFKRFAKSGPVVAPGTNLYQVQDQLDKFYRNRMTGYRGRIWKWTTSLKENYFKNPWTFIAVVSATLLLALTMAQTYYTARPYWDSNHKNN